MERRRADTEKLGGRAQVIRIDWQDAEVRIAFEPEDPLTPETVYERAGPWSCLAGPGDAWNRSRLRWAEPKLSAPCGPFWGMKESGPV